MKPSTPLPTLRLAHEALPASLRQLVDELGEAGALRFTGVYGGQRVSVPKQPLAEHPMRAALGGILFETLVDRCAGLSMDVPKCDGFLRELRHEQVRQYREQGLTMDEIAGETGYCRRHVINILHGEAGVDTHTLDMFAEPKPTAPLAAPRSYAGMANDPFGMGGSIGMRDPV
jgi:hypothetical protein